MQYSLTEMSQGQGTTESLQDEGQGTGTTRFSWVCPGQRWMFLWQGRFRVSLSLVIPKIALPTTECLKSGKCLFKQVFLLKDAINNLNTELRCRYLFGCHQFRSWISKSYSFGNRNKVHFDLHCPEKPKWEHDRPATRPQKVMIFT